MNALQANGRRIFFFGALGGLLFGYDTGVISGAMLFITEDFGYRRSCRARWSLRLLLGAMLGAAFAGPLSDRLGRRKLIILAAITFTVGALRRRRRPERGVLIAARFIIGLAVGSAALVVPLYLSEIAPTEIRGAIALAEPADDRDRHPGGLHRQRDPRLVRRLAADARPRRGSVAGPARRHAASCRRRRATWCSGRGGGRRTRCSRRHAGGDESPKSEIEEIREVEQEESGNGLRGCLRRAVGAPRAARRDRAGRASSSWSGSTRSSTTRRPRSPTSASGTRARSTRTS